jgi:hypothetical protein
MSRWLIYNGIPYEMVDLMEDWELMAHSIVFAQFQNGNQEWDWDAMKFIEKP